MDDGVAPHGAFLPWIDAEFEMSEPTALRFIQVASRLGTSVTVTDLSPKVLYALAAPSTPDEVVAAVETKASAGEKVSLDEVRALKRAAAEAEKAKAEAESAPMRSSEQTVGE